MSSSARAVTSCCGSHPMHCCRYVAASRQTSWWLCMCCALCSCLKRGEGKEMLPVGNQVIPSRRNKACIVFSRTAEKGCKHASSRWMQPFWSSSSLEGLRPISSQSSQPLSCPAAHICSSASSPGSLGHQDSAVQPLTTTVELHHPTALQCSS